ncbi:MAG TPA: hypothetical protein VFW09_22150, partial [Solirubrobacteraceae bacterium]|nr:hypothetical protein [Solirubrobacteraceae bacterium]
YAWSRCDTGGSNCTAISGATSSTYQIQSADAGSTLKVAVTASNTAGNSQPASSSPTAVVTSGSQSQTFGTTTVGGSSSSFITNRKQVNAYSLSQSGSVTKLSVYLQPGSGSGTADVEGVIYADSGGQPGALIATSSQLAFPSTGAAGWYDLTFSSPAALAPGSYWIGVLTGGTTQAAGYRYKFVSASRYSNYNQYSSGPSNPFGSGTTDNQQMSLYATYTPAS